MFNKKKSSNIIAGMKEEAIQTHQDQHHIDYQIIFTRNRNHFGHQYRNFYEHLNRSYFGHQLHDYIGYHHCRKKSKIK